MFLSFSVFLSLSITDLRSKTVHDSTGDTLGGGALSVYLLRGFTEIQAWFENHCHMGFVRSPADPLLRTLGHIPASP